LGKKIKQVFWTTRATKDLEKVTRFNIKLHGKDKAFEIAVNLRKSTEALQNTELDTTEFGAIDEDFKHLKREYRKLINHHCKITYRIGKDMIYVNRVFDTRQNPKKNK